MEYERSLPKQRSSLLPDPPLARDLFGSARFAWVWLVLRAYLGWQWLEAGRQKISDDAWMDGGVALKGFWERVVDVPEQGRPAITYGWYRDLLTYMLDHQWYTWFAKVVAVSEVLIGIALILGLFTGIAAFGGSFLNFNFMLAGTASTNPVLFTLAVLLMLAWKTAGWIGLDRWVLPLIGTPWSHGYVFGRRAAHPSRPSEAT